MLYLTIKNKCIYCLRCYALTGLTHFEHCPSPCAVDLQRFRGWIFFRLQIGSRERTCSVVFFRNIKNFINFNFLNHHHLVVCLKTGSKPLPKRSLHVLRSKASSFKWEYPLLSLRSSSSFLRLLPCLLVTSISPFIFPSITCFRRQFLRKMWPIQLAFPFLLHVGYSSAHWLEATLLHFSHDRSNWSSW